MNKIKEFEKIDPEIQFFIINSQFPKNKEKNVKLFDQIKIKSNKTDILFYNDALKTTNFYSLLSRFKFIQMKFFILHLHSIIFLNWYQMSKTIS